MTKQDLIKNLAPMQWLGGSNQMFAATSLWHYLIEPNGTGFRINIRYKINIEDYAETKEQAIMKCQKHYEETALGFFNISE